jgi:predicted dehydrogenase
VRHHLASAGAVAEAGLPCLVEKPPAADRDGAEALAGLAPAPWIGFNRRFSHRAVVSRVCAVEGPLELDFELRYRRASWRPFESADDALLDVGVHLADLAIGMGGEADVVAAQIDPRRFTLELRTARGPARLRGATDRPYLERTVARGEGFTASRRSGGLIDGLAARLSRREHPLIASIARQLEAFARAARGGAPGELATSADGVRAMAVIDAARRLGA